MHSRGTISTLTFLFVKVALSASNKISLPASSSTTSVLATFPILTFSLGIEFIDSKPDNLLEFDHITLYAFEPFEDIWQGYSYYDPSYYPSIIGFDALIGTNYSSVCSSSTTIFYTPLNLQNCLTLAITTVLLQNNVIQLENGSVQSARRSLQVDDLHAFNGLAVLDRITSCISSTCQNSSNSICSPTVIGNLTEADDPKNNIRVKLQKLHNSFNDYCNDVNAQPNSDVVGPGVAISYLLQSFIIAILFFASKIHRAASRYSAWRQRRGNNSQITSHSKPNRFRLNLASCFSAIEAVTIDFQEAQAVFVSTIQIATLYFYSQAEVTQTSNSYAEANATIALAFNIAVYGLIPVLLGQSVLQRAGKRWWYTTILTCIPTVLAWWCITRPTQPNYTSLLAKLKKTSTATECGGNIIPMDYCGGRNQNLELDYIPIELFASLIYNSTLVQIAHRAVYIGAPFLLADQVYAWTRGSPHWSQISQFCKRVSRWSKLRDSTKNGIAKIVHLIIFLIWVTYQTVLFTSLIYNMSLVLVVFKYVTKRTGGWSYGQLVAVLVWLPIGLKLVYYIIFGIEEGVESRLGERFSVQAR